uniref:G-protein coupled receptors family 1 profile domain-containing protein n=1 Tax=Anguilla anguilla TaxID=7936 RepID=A0A0E9W8M8_ANGAN
MLALIMLAFITCTRSLNYAECIIYCHNTILVFLFMVWVSEFMIPILTYYFVNSNKNINCDILIL